MDLILYAICASTLVIWSTSLGHDDLRQSCTHPALKGTINYVAIPSFLLHGWAKRNPNLVIFDLCTDSEIDVRHKEIPGLLTVSKSDLPNLLKWLPSKSTVVFSRGDVIERFDARTEGAFLQLGIETIYIVDKSVDFPLTVTWEESVPGERRPNRSAHSKREQICYRTNGDNAPG